MFLGKEFEPHPLLRNRHLMTIVAAFWPRRFPWKTWPAERREFEVAPDARLVAHCHWQRDRRSCPTIVSVHGMEGSSESRYMLGTTKKALARGFNVVRLNQRNCGGSEHLTSTLYDSGMSADLDAVLRELIQRDGLTRISLVGFSMGGNLAVKLAGEWGTDWPAEVSCVAAVSPSMDLAACADAIARPENRLYQWYFLLSLRMRMRRKARLFPDRYDLAPLEDVRTLRQFDNAFTAPHGGYGDAATYYARASALREVGNIRVPTLIIHAQDDPFIPFAPCEHPSVRENPAIALLTPAHGGHCAFLGRANAGEDCYWAENRVVEFCARCADIKKE